MAKRSSRPKPNRRKPAKAYPSVITVTVTILFCAVSMVSVATWDLYSFAETDLFPLWYVALGMGLLCGGLFVGKLMGKGHGVGKRIGGFLLISVICFFAVGTMLAHVNHLLDTSEPERYTVVIRDTDYRSGPKRTSHRTFTVTVQGETFDLGVSAGHYHTFDKGDYYVVEYHRGALGEPYYIGVGGVSEEADKP